MDGALYRLGHAECQLGGGGRIREGGRNLNIFFYNIFLNICVARLSTDQMEDWTTAESALFEEAMEKYGKGEGFVCNP